METKGIDKPPAGHSCKERQIQHVNNAKPAAYGYETPENTAGLQAFLVTTPPFYMTKTFNTWLLIHVGHCTPE